MSRTTDWVIMLEETSQERHIAKLLGITYEELIELNYEIITNENDSGSVSSYTIKLLEKPAIAILDQIERLEPNMTVTFEPWEFEAEYDYLTDQFDSITESRINIKLIEKEIDNIYELSLLQKKGDKLKNILNRQIFISLIGILETFLFETFMKLVFNNDDYLQAFVENHPTFKIHKFELREIFQKQNTIRNTAKKVILDTIFHNLRPVREMYRSTFNIDFPDIGILNQFVIIRHDLVHRNGKSKEGIEKEIEDEQISELIKESKKFIDSLCKELKLK